MQRSLPGSILLAASVSILPAACLATAGPSSSGGEVGPTDAATLDTSHHDPDTRADIGADDAGAIPGADADADTTGNAGTDTGTDAAPDTAPPAALRASEHVSFGAPDPVAPGESFEVRDAFVNTGTTPWTRADGFYLGSEGPRDNFTWGTNRIAMGADDVGEPGAIYTFVGDVTAPEDPGEYPMQWQLLQDAVEWFGETTPVRSITVEGPAADPPDGPRTPDPPPGERLPLPDMENTVEDLAREHPDALAASCLAQGGSWEFLDRLVDRLRETDTRWGYNWKRGNVGDASQDVVDYHYGRGESEGSTDVYIIDVIVGHCGDAPSPGWLDQTEPTRDAGTIGRWTGRGRF